MAARSLLDYVRVRATSIRQDEKVGFLAIEIFLVENK